MADAQQSLGGFDRLVRWPAVSNLHLTLKFLGEVPEADLPGACEATKRAAARSAPFRFVLQGLGCFPPKGLVRILWVGVEPQDDGLRQCQRALEEEMAGVGFRPEKRPYSPHLTIGRVRPGANTRELRAALETAEFRGPRQDPREMLLFESRLTPRGAIYTPITRCRLGQP